MYSITSKDIKDKKTRQLKTVLLAFQCKTLRAETLPKVLPEVNIIKMKTYYGYIAHFYLFRYSKFSIYLISYCQVDSLRRNFIAKVTWNNSKLSLRSMRLCAASFDKTESLISCGASRKNSSSGTRSMSGYFDLKSVQAFIALT